MRGLNERTVLVTGGANGIGAATARRLAEEGCTVGILDMDVEAAEDVADEITARGRRASFHVADISDYDAVSRAVESFEASFEEMRWTAARASFPAISISPMWLTSNNPARSRTARCSATIPEYSTGISQPANGTMRAPEARCRALSGVFLSGATAVCSMWEIRGIGNRQWYCAASRRVKKPTRDDRAR